MASSAKSSSNQAPDLGIPDSPHIVEVSIINTTSTIRGVQADTFLTPPIDGHKWMATPVFSFLVQHPELKRSLLFDLGIRKDWENLSPPMLSVIRKLGWTIHVDKDVREILEEGGVDSSKIEAIILSHGHFDHVGNPATFGPDTALVVGPGFKEKATPGYPTNQSSYLLETAYAGRELIELNFDTGRSGPNHTFQPLPIGRLRALDYFGDGSLYLLDTPGHAPGHISALARVTSSSSSSSPSSAPSFVLLAGDAFHHAGEFRPSAHLPLPSDIIPDPFEADAAPLEYHYGLPGQVFARLFADRGLPAGGTRPFYSRPPPPSSSSSSLPVSPSFHDDVDGVARTLEKLQELDARDNVLVAAAHDESLLGVLEFFPRGRLNGFVRHGTVRRVRWRFLKDFAHAVGKQGHELGRKREWCAETTMREGIKGV
ncbi:hypothetical protein VTK26DRAFT_6586 [Humicola hyalothermophila]